LTTVYMYLSKKVSVGSRKLNIS